MSLSGTWDARKDHCGFGYEVSTALPVLQPASPCDALGACPLSIFLEVLTFFTRVACPPQLPLAPVRADARAPALLAPAPDALVLAEARAPALLALAPEGAPALTPPGGSRRRSG